MNYGTMYEQINNNYGEYVNKIALLYNYHMYYAYDYRQEAIFEYEKTYDDIINQIITNIHDSIIYEHHIGCNSRSFKKYFTAELQDLHHILSTGFFDFLYNIFYECYSEKYLFDDLDASWLTDIYDDELGGNKAFGEFVNIFS